MILESSSVHDPWYVLSLPCSVYPEHAGALIKYMTFGHVDTAAGEGRDEGNSPGVDQRIATRVRGV